MRDVLLTEYMERDQDEYILCVYFAMARRWMDGWTAESMAECRAKTF
jgi:hypothetical protein